NCAPCHGATGKGDGWQAMVDSTGVPTRPRDLTAGVYKGSHEPAEVFRRLVAGLPGSPMPSNLTMYGEDGWHLTHYVLSLSSPEQRAKVEMHRLRIVARRVDELPAHPDAGAWEQAESIAVHLMPLWWRPERPESVTVRALHDGTDLAVLLVWHDETLDSSAIRPQDFRDAAAVQFALGPDQPFLAMGDSTGPVNVWMWKAERQADLETAFQDIDSIYPNLGIDSYPNTLRSPLEQPARHALTLQSDPTFVTAWGAGNIVADPTRRSAAEDLSARGFGTLRARPLVDQAVQADGEWATDTYRVQFRRALAGQGEGAVSLPPGGAVEAAFAVWNGSAGDRDGKKSVTLWQELVLEP
ncbi:MAG TPA: ethylbenzene dehydrogenase-related protein, partial [Planctomycetota bacterium]|nr:ethylbenzene dehydrogenase-related protein [Planctomycetota bacterium]